MRYYLFLILLLTACKCPKKAMGTGEQEVSGSTLTYILSDSYGGAAEEELLVIRSKGELQKFFAGVNKTRKPGLPLPEIDFNENMVLVYSAGETRAGNPPELIPLQLKEDRILMGVKNEKGQNDNVSTAITMPFVIYTMRRTDKEVVLERDRNP
jgi:hypothetical protein